MNDIEKRNYDMLVRVRDFGANRSADFPPTGLGGQLFDEVATIVSELERHATIQTANASPVSSVAKTTARTTLKEDLKRINRTARAIAVINPSLKKKFNLPRAGDQSLLNGARMFAEQAEPLVAEFTKHELPADFLVSPRKDIDAFQFAVTAQNHSKEARVQATASLDAVLTRASKAIQRLDAVVNNKYKKDGPSLSAWVSASHLERNNGKAKEQTKAAPAGAPASSASGKSASS